MIDGLAVVDAHMHVPRLSTVSAAWLDWAVRYGQDSGWRDAFDADGDPDPARLDALLDAEGVDAALLFAEYSPGATGIQPVEDLLPITAHNPRRYRLVANVNPRLHHPPAAEAERQLALGAVAVKVHPVHGAFRVDRDDMYPVYDLCAERGVPVIVHTGPSIFPGSQADAGDPALMDPIAAAYPSVPFVLAHGGRGHWYADAAGMALARDNVWIDLAGLPPKRLPDYYAGFDLPALARKWIFGTDWPGVPGVARNARAVAALGLPDDTLAAVLARNACHIYPGLTIP
jgi:predicted TIM-barrel fold metal-dependent hydrolase